MGMKEMKLENLADLDNGRVSLAFTHELKRAVQDCLDRPGDSTARKVTVVFTLKPITDEAGDCDTVNGDFKIKSTVPERKSKTYNFAARKSGHLVFSEESPQNVQQTTFMDGE